MKTIGNIIWFLIVGLVSWIAWTVIGLVWCITIIGIPFGTECFKIATLVAWPFGKVVEKNFTSHPIANLLWCFLGGIALSFFYITVGTVLILCIVGIPFGLQCYKLASLAISPFGADITPENDVED